MVAPLFDVCIIPGNTNKLNSNKQMIEQLLDILLESRIPVTYLATTQNSVCIGRIKTHTIKYFDIFNQAI